MITVTVPGDKNTYEFPDGTTEEEIRKAMGAAVPSDAPDIIPDSGGAMPMKQPSFSPQETEELGRKASHGQEIIKNIPRGISEALGLNLVGPNLMLRHKPERPPSERPEEIRSMPASQEVANFLKSAPGIEVSLGEKPSDPANILGAVVDAAGWATPGISKGMKHAYPSMRNTAKALESMGNTSRSLKALAKEESETKVGSWVGKYEKPAKVTPEAPAAPPEGQPPYAKPPQGFAPERPVAGKVGPPEAGLEYPRPEDMGWAEKTAVEGTPKPEKIVKGPLGDQSGQAALATEGAGTAKDLSRLGPDDTVTLYRGAQEPIYGEGGKVDLKLSRWTPDLETATRNAHGGTVYETTVPAKEILPMQELFDPKVASPDNLKKGAALAAKYVESAHPQVSASFDPSLSWEAQGLLRGKYDIKVRPSVKPGEIDLGLTGNEPTGWSKRSLPHNASATESLQKVAAIQDLNTGKVYTGPSHPAIISKNLEQLTPLIDAERAKPGWLVEGKFYESATKALNAMRGVSEEAAPAVKALGAAARDLEQTGQATARNAVHEMNNQAVSQAGKDVSQDLFLLDMGKDPNKKISKQFYDHVINNPERITETSLKLGMTEDELAAAMLNHASQAGKSLQVWSKFVKEMDIVNPKWGALLKDTVPPATWLDRVSGVPRRIIETWRAMLVTQMATSVRNVASQGARVGIDIIEIPLRKMLGEKDLAWTEGISQFANLFRFKTMATKMNEITALFPGLKKEYFSTYSSDLARMETPEGWLADKVNFLNKAQEMMFRRTVFYSGLEAEMASKGKNLSTMLSTGRALEIPVEALQRAGKRSLEYTFADTEPGLAFVRAINKIPGGVGHLFITYPRFMMNQLKFLHEYSPLGLTNLAGPQAKKEIRNGSQKTMARAIEGSMLLTGAYGIRAGFFGDIAGEKWYQLKRSDGSTYSIQPFNPLATYLWAGDVMNRAIKGTLRFDNVLDGWGALTGMRGINLLWGVEKMKNAAADLHDAAPGTEEYKAAKNYFKGVMGTFLGGFATPATTLRDFYSGFNDYITKDTNVAPLSGPATSRVPVLEETLPPSYAGTRESPRRTLLPVVRQLTGVSLSPKISDYESEISRFGFLRKDWLVSTSIPEFDNIVARETGRLAEDIINPFVESQEYKGMTEGEKEATLQSVMSKIRSAGFKMAATEDIDLYMRTLEKAPKHKRRLMEEILNSNDSPGEAQ